MINANSSELIEKKLRGLAKPVRLVLFTTDTGCPTCPEAVELARAIKNKAGKIALETYDVVMDRDKAEQYGVKLAPALVVEGREGRFVTFCGLLEDVFLEVLLKTIHAVSEAHTWFPDKILHTLAHLANDVKIRVFVNKDCSRCRPVAETAIGLAFESPYIATDIIIASDYPELVRKYNMTTLPKTIFGENLHVDGHVQESEFLSMIFQTEGVKTGPEKKCLVCGNPSPDIICQNCRTRIQAEAVEHKIKREKM
jgi:thiol-disulfide isomerase/thioredoxin